MAKNKQKTVFQNGLFPTTSNNQQPTTTTTTTTTNNQQPTTNNQQPTNNNQQTTTNKQQQQHSSEELPCQLHEFHHVNTHFPERRCDIGRKQKGFQPSDESCLHCSSCGMCCCLNDPNVSRGKQRYSAKKTHVATQIKPFLEKCAAAAAAAAAGKAKPTTNNKQRCVWRGW